jgi:hypothetical protein
MVMVDLETGDEIRNISLYDGVNKIARDYYKSEYLRRKIIKELEAEPYLLEVEKLLLAKLKNREAFH